MRLDDPIKEDSEVVVFNFHFQVATSAGRRACTIRVEAHDYYDATRVFRENWGTIESLARESLASAADGSAIKLEMLPPKGHFFEGGQSPPSAREERPVAHSPPRVFAPSLSMPDNTPIPDYVGYTERATDIGKLTAEAITSEYEAAAKEGATRTLIS
jgi:hypothetical protein